tara:strand:+ start:502 stop:828 length:327 start_codon:yes stop_codon:yes gene_type:complete
MKSYWSQLVQAISEALFPERKDARLAAERKELKKKHAKEAEVKLKKFTPDEEPAGEISLPADKPKRARTAKGRYKGDDESTPDVNEAWVGGKAPKKKKAKKSKKKKKK